ncbi:hypothetical protein N9N28_01955 [Rubripirellula amarantea]|nr:hypothetical protein [Rubripirellula amarantea]
MKFQTALSALCAFVFVVALSPGVTSAQDRLRYPDEFVDGLSKQDDIPRIVLSTERGRELVDQLKQLRFAESTFGPRHPSAKFVLNDIATTKTKLMALAKEKSAEESGSAMALSNLNTSNIAASVSEMSESELRVLVVRLMDRIDQLQAQIEKLQADVIN